jgi:outer membrane protein
MHRKILPLLAAVLWLGWAGAAASQEVKIGIVDIEQALVSTDEGKAAREEMSRKVRDATAQIEPLMEQHKTMAEDLQQKKYALSDDAKFKKQVELAELENKIKSKREELQGVLKIAEVNALMPLQDKLHGIIQAIGKEQGFTLILARNNPYVMYSREALDITDLVVARFNKKG